MRWTQLQAVAAPRRARGVHVRLQVDRRAWLHMLEHFAGARTEEGGILCGYRRQSRAGDHVVHVQHALGARRRSATRVSFAFVPGTWEALLAQKRRVCPRTEIVGWFHSHPGFGAFFSGTDRATQRQCAGTPDHVGLVIDPVRGEYTAYAGPESEALSAEALPGVVEVAKRWLLPGADALARSCDVIEVARTIDPLTVRLRCGRTLRVPDLLVPVAERNRSSKCERRLYRKALAFARGLFAAAPPGAVTLAGPEGEAAWQWEAGDTKRVWQLIRHLEVRGRLFATMLVERGLALPAPLPGTPFERELEAAARRARAHHRGLWSRRYRRLVAALGA